MSQAEDLPRAAPFRWPDGKRAAISLTFDDARYTQVDVGIPVLNRWCVSGTFYVSPWNMQARLDGWRAAVECGHEVGNHTLTHPCGANFGFARGNALEDYTLERIEREMTDANEAVAAAVGVTPITFAYPCGQTYVGRGEGVRSYVPLVARHFIAGRLGFNEVHNDPAQCDLAQLWGQELDCASWDRTRELLDACIAAGGWTVLFGHEVGDGGRQTVLVETLDRLCQYVSDSGNGWWVDTVANIATYVKEARHVPSRPEGS